MPFLMASKKKWHLPLQNKTKGMKIAEGEAAKEDMVCPSPQRDLTYSLEER